MTPASSSGKKNAPARRATNSLLAITAGFPTTTAGAAIASAPPE